MGSGMRKANAAFFTIFRKKTGYLSPARGAGGTVTVRQPCGTKPAWMAIYDDKTRMVFAVNHNTDTGDAREYADAPEYPAHMTTLAYRYGGNYLICAMKY
jgi:hypothetical protein